ncbi:unnamed protein product [Schistosoma bovis]|nr:unnamed protein product [Schistosoma bovis]
MNVISILQFNNFPMKIIRSILKQNNLLHYNNDSNEMPWIGTAVLPYRHGTTEEIQRILKHHRIKVYYKTTNTLRNTLVRLKEKIPFMSTQNCVYKLGCIDCDAYYIGESSREIVTRAKEHIRYTKKPPNNPVELNQLQIKSAIAVHAIFNNHQIDFKNIKILQKGFSNYKERRVAEAFHIMLNPTSLNRKEGLTIHPTWTIYPNHSV